MLPSYPLLPLTKKIWVTKPRARSHKSMTALVALVVVLFSRYEANAGAKQESKQSVNVVVICDDTAAQKMIRDSLLTHFRSLQDLEVVKQSKRLCVRHRSHQLL